MNNKWTTLVEEQTEKANESIAKVLEEVGEDSRSSRKNKFIAVTMASIGLVLIGFGVWPFLNSTLLQGDVTNNSNNIFTNNPEDVENVPLKDPVPPESLVPDEETDSTDDLDDVMFDPDSTLLPLDPSVDLPDLSAGPLPNFGNGLDTLPDIFPPSLDEETTLPNNAPNPSLAFPGAAETVETYPQNTHVGTSDPQTVVFGQEAASENLYGAAQEMNRSGPAEWAALLLALPGALLLRRKKLFR